MRAELKVFGAALAGLLLVGPTLGAAAPANAPAAANQGFSVDRLKRLDAWTAGHVDAGRLVGASTLIVRNNQTVKYSSFGVADRVSNAPIKQDTIFRIYSQTKPIVGVAMMMLFEEGKWRLDDPVTKYIPEFKDLKVLTGMDDKGQPITVAMKRPPTMREIMTHTAGFGYGLAPDDPVGGLYRASGLLASTSMDDFIGKMAKLPLANQPGERWRYSVAVDIQGALIERLSGQSLPDFLQSRLFGPLKMVDTGFAVPANKVSRLAGIYYFDPRTGKAAEAAGPQVQDFTKPPSFPSGGGGLVSTTHDYGRFAQMILNKGELDGAQILAPATIDLMSTNHLPDGMGIAGDGTTAAASPGIGFGLGFAVVTDPAKAGTLVGAGTLAWGGAAATWFWIDPKNQIYFLGMVQLFGRPEGMNLNESTRTLTYGALLEP